jgi:ADP-ribose pyrophosphatase
MGPEGAVGRTDRSDGPRKWPRIRSVREQDYRIFTVRRDFCVSPRTGREHDFVVLESADWVSVVPVASDRRLVMVRQYRHGTDQVTLETPGGLLDSGLSPLEGARHELRQETGYGGGDWTLLGSIAPVPAVFTNLLHVFLADGVELQGEMQLDAMEDIRVELVPLERVRAMVASGEIDHAQVLAALYLYDVWTVAHPDRERA